MRVESNKLGQSLVVKVLEPRLGADKAPAFKQTMGKFIADGERTFILDLSAVEFIDSTGLGAILSLLKQLGKGGEVMICGATGTVASMFKLTRMDRVFSLYANANEAAAALVR
jgi:anti-sigma B factor antagonist